MAALPRLALFGSEANRHILQDMDLRAHELLKGNTHACGELCTWIIQNVVSLHLQVRRGGVRACAGACGACGVRIATPAGESALQQQS